MKKSKIFLKAFIIAFAFAFLLPGCNKAEEIPIAEALFSEPQHKWGEVSGKTITIWGDEGELLRPYMSSIFSRYEELTGNKIETLGLSKEDIDKKVPAAFNLDGLEKPDILLSYGGTNLDQLNPHDNFYDFTEAEWVDDLTDTAINQSIYGGKVVGLPYSEASVSGILYNKEVFKKYNLSIPTNQQEFMEVCEALLGNGITPMYLLYGDTSMLLYQLPLDSIVEDSDVLTALNNGSLSYSQIPEMRKIVEWYKTMSDKGYFGEDYINNNWDGMDQAMKGGEYAMMLCWDTWAYTNFTGDPSKIGIMPAFIGTPEHGCFEGANIILSLVNKHSANLDASLDLVSFMSDPYNYNIAFSGLYTSQIFVNQVGSITTPQYMESERLIDKNYYYSTAWLRIKGFSQIDAKYIQQYMQGECTVEECLENMDEARLKRSASKSEQP